MSPKTTPSAASARTFGERGRWSAVGLVSAVAWLTGDPCRPVFPAHRPMRLLLPREGRTPCVGGPGPLRRVWHRKSREQPEPMDTEATVNAVRDRLAGHAATRYKAAAVAVSAAVSV